MFIASTEVRDVRKYAQDVADHAASLISDNHVALSAEQSRDTVSSTSTDGATPVAEWPVEIDEPVLIYVVHTNAQFEKDPKVRREQWEGWTVGRWIKHNKGGWMYYGMMGTVTHVAPLPASPSSVEQLPNEVAK